MSNEILGNTILITEWNLDRNISLDPYKVTLGSNKKAWWKCSKGHEWEAQICSRASGIGCPYCSNKKITSENNLAYRFTELAKEWDAEKNELSPAQVFPGTVKLYWWICNRGHSYQTSPNKRTSSNRGCPYCSGRRVSDGNSLAIRYPIIANEFHSIKNKGIDVKQLTVKSHQIIWWQCKRGHEWQTSVSNRTKGTNCPYCNSQVSKNELRIFSELKHFFNSTVLKRKVNGFECDILLPDLSVAIEYDGVYWHKHTAVNDRKKNIGLLNAGIFLIRVRESGLQKLSEYDIIFDQNTQSVLVPTKQILHFLLQNRALELDVKIQIESYFPKDEFINDDLYRSLLERLPSPILENSLEFKFPGLIKEWNTNKNKGLLPSDVSSKSSLEVWWKCEKGHEWESSISNRTAGNNCPYCAHQRITFENSLSGTRPDLVDEWDFEKNNNIAPDQVFAYTTRRYWWICKNGHEWMASPSNRSSFGKGKNTNCPYCSNKKVDSHNSLETTNSTLAKEWNYEKNGLLRPTMVTQGSEKKVWWICQKMHQWEATIASRNKGNGCPYCSNLFATKENCLQANYPDIAKEWNYERNEKLTPEEVVKFSGKKVWWKCMNGHEWKAAVGSRTNLKAKCPYCSNLFATKENCLKTNYPDIAKEWNYERNEKLTPEEVVQFSSKKVWWKCMKGHEWKAVVVSRTRLKRGCPYCSNLFATKENCLKTNYPDIAKEWNYERNEKLIPEEVVKFSNKKVWWTCTKGHEWRALVVSRTKEKTGCPYCSNRLATNENCLQTNFPDIAKEWNYDKNGKLTPNDVTKKSHRLVWWLCEKGHEWTAMVKYRVEGAYKCPTCKLNIIG